MKAIIDFLLTCLMFTCGCLAIFLGINFFFGINFSSTGIVATILIAIIGFNVLMNFKTLTTKRAIGLTSKKFLFFLFVLSLWINGTFLYFFYTQTTVTWDAIASDLGISLFIGIILSFVLTAGISVVLVKRKRQELEILGFTLIASVDPTRIFDSADEKIINTLLQQRRLYIFSGFMEKHFFCRSNAIDVKTLIKKFVDRSQVFVPINNNLLSDPMF